METNTVTKEELKQRILNCYEHDLIIEGDYLPWSPKNGEGLLHEVYDNKEEFKDAFYKANEGKTALDSIFEMIWSSNCISFNEDVCGNFIYIKEPSC